MPFHKYKKFSDYRERETVDEFIARGGYIKKAVTKYDFIGVKEKKFIPDNDQIKHFYQSKEWSKLKQGYYLKCYREDRFYCQQCGCTNEKMMRVDHVRSVRYNWDLRLDKNNIQILCFKCNREKKSTEYRANGINKCEVNCKKCTLILNNTFFEDENFNSEVAISRWLFARNQLEIDNYIKSQLELAEENLKLYYQK